MASNSVFHIPTVTNQHLSFLHSLHLYGWEHTILPPFLSLNL